MNATVLTLPTADSRPHSNALFCELMELIARYDGRLTTYEVVGVLEVAKQEVVLDLFEEI